MPWLFVTGGLFLFSMLFYQKKLFKSFGLCCENCGGLLVNSKLVILTGNCPHCGIKVLVDVSPPEVPRNANNTRRKEFISQLEVINKKENRRGIIAFCLIISIFLGCFLLAKYLDYLQEHGAFDWAVGQIDLLAVIIPATILFAFVGVLIYSR